MPRACEHEAVVPRSQQRYASSVATLCEGVVVAGARAFTISGLLMHMRGYRSMLCSSAHLLHPESCMLCSIAAFGSFIDASSVAALCEGALVAGDSDH